MRTEAELRAAQEALRWYTKSGWYLRQDPATANNVIGAMAALEWMAGTAGEGDPLAGMLKAFKAMRQGPERN